MVVNFAGKYKLSNSENFEQYMKAMGVGAALRKTAALMSPTCEIDQNGDDFVIKMNVPIITTHVQKFRIGEPFEDISPTRDKVMVTVHWEGDKLVFNDVEKSDPPHYVTREISGDEMYVKCVKGDVVCTRTFKRI
ncbi:sodium/calcium exchanger regulatory protein 1-like [Anneissia japonica]|uniref:sodium/calcium exchanger regulatory protein 1-like n=1 Tax=Anneissia japonica TaxID=1529436 RepID=UPI001425773E|nr:sodium/calcium exchanger regulatory protein 1-like [Anneissia japonica]